MTTPKVKLLDCTIRDGGYYNDWDFSRAEVQTYINNLVRGGVDIIEIGFRFTPKSDFHGPYAYTSEQTLQGLVLPEGVQFGVMVNASDYLKPTWQDDIERSFVNAADSAVSLVRIAAHIGQVRECGPLVKWFKDAGYDCGFNIMQISQATDAEISDLVEYVETEFVDFEALYFADSLGNLTTSDVSRIVGLFREKTDKPIGFHGHDNIGLGVSNSLAAINAGATWVDATVTGMGRGAGNTQTEYLSLELSRAGLHQFDMLEIQKAATGWLASLQKKCGWGTNIFYYEAGLRSLHPSYVQQLLSTGLYDPIDVLVMIDALANQETPTSYSGANIDRAVASLMSHPLGANSLAVDWKNRPVLLLAGGPNGANHVDAVMSFAEQVNAVVLAVNHLNFISPERLDGVVCIHPARMMNLLEDETWNNVQVFTSVASLPTNLAARMTGRTNVNDYGVKVSTDGELSAGDRGCTIPTPHALAYASAIAHTAGAREILLAGFDGYDGRSDLYQQSAQIIEAAGQDLGLTVKSLTKTYFDVPVQSIYSR